MESIIDRITQGKFWHFHGGIHPPEQKTITSDKPIKHLPLPEQLILPLQQHIGRQGDLIVNVGDKVLKGQALTQSSNPMAVPVHAPTSGTISAIKTSVIAHPSGLSELCLFIDVDGEDTWKTREICQDFTKLSQLEIISKIADAGIAGMGGAGFPTHIKVNAKPNIEFLIINAAECEPYITADDLLMCEQSEAIVDGIKILEQLLSPTAILIGIEDNKPQAIKALQQATQYSEKIKVCVLPTKYPTGGERQLIKILTGKEVNSGTLPVNSGIVVQNVATCFAISDAVINDIPLIRRVVTLTGKALSRPQNVWALLGTKVSYLLEQTGFVSEVIQAKSAPNSPLQNPPVIMGGPLMGFSILNEQVPIVKTSNCILAPSKIEMPSAFDNYSNEVECIRCGQCADVCPSQLLPQELQWSAKAKDHQQLMELNLFDCIDCGACAYVCPSQIPLVQYYRVAKAEIRQQQQLDIKSEKAKARFEARKLRLEQEKIARQEKHEKAAAARKAAMNKKSADGASPSSAVAAALARVKAKKAAESNNTVLPVASSETQSGDEQTEISPVQAAIARAKAKKLAKANSTQAPVATNETQTDDEQTEMSPVQAAIARAKAKRLAKANSAQAPVATNEQLVQKVPVANEVKAEQDGNKKQIEDNETKDNVIDDKKVRIAAAVAKAKAKAKKAQENKSTTEQNEISVEIKQDTTSEKEINTITEAEEKKARIASAVAKAKAKAELKRMDKAQQASNSNNEEST
ncbi:MAG: electron transport complex protein RnfC [Colwellia sp.]|jgi:electron transport complex protein RnfC